MEPKGHGAELDPKHVNNLANYALLPQERGQLDEAEQVYRSISEVLKRHREGAED